MIRKLKRYVKKDQQGYLKVAALFGYSDTAVVRNWVRRESVPNYVESRLKQLLDGEINVTISVK